MARSNSWDVDISSIGYGKHAYRKIDPDTINPEEYAVSLRGDQMFKGEVREYNSANNLKPEGNADIDDLMVIGSIFKTEAPEWEGTWIVTDIPRVRTPRIYIPARRCSLDESYKDLYQKSQSFEHRVLRNTFDVPKGTEEIPAELLGLMVDENNEYVQVRTTLLKRGTLDRNMRTLALTGVTTKERLESNFS